MEIVLHLLAACRSRGPQVVAGKHYISVGYVSTATVDQLRQVPFPRDAKTSQGSSLYPKALLSEYLPTDEILSQEVIQTAQTATQGTTTMYDAAVHLEDYLHTFTYSTNNPEPPAGQDAVAWFLREKQGFCTFFASAMALMGRALGMPTRVVEGFTQGSYDTKTKTWVVTGQDAHAWTQIYFSQYGWINFEPTSNFDPFVRLRSGIGVGGLTPTVGLGHEGTPTVALRDQKRPGKSHNAGSGPANQAGTALIDVGLNLSLLIALILVFVALFATWWRLLYRGLSPVTAAFVRMLWLGRWAGAPPKRSQTPDEYAEQLAGVIPGQRRSLHRLSELYAAERWGGGLERDKAAEVPRLYDQVRASTVGVIARRARHLPLALLRGARHLRRRTRRDRFDLEN